MSLYLLLMILAQCKFKSLLSVMKLCYKSSANTPSCNTFKLHRLTNHARIGLLWKTWQHTMRTDVPSNACCTEYLFVMDCWFAIVDPQPTGGQICHYDFSMHFYNKKRFLPVCLI